MEYQARFAKFTPQSWKQVQNVFQSMQKIHVFQNFWHFIEGTILFLLHFHAFQVISHTQGVPNIPFLLDVFTSEKRLTNEHPYMWQQLQVEMESCTSRFFEHLNLLCCSSVNKHPRELKIVLYHQILLSICYKCTEIGLNLNTSRTLCSRRGNQTKPVTTTHMVSHG